MSHLTSLQTAGAKALDLDFLPELGDAREYVHWHGENQGSVPFHPDFGQCLKITQLDAYARTPRTLSSRRSRNSGADAVRIIRSGYEYYFLLKPLDQATRLTSEFSPLPFSPSSLWHGAHASVIRMPHFFGHIGR